MKLENIKIATILPYKENYSVDKASAASLWFQTLLNQNLKKNTIYGNTKSRKFLTKNYQNIYLKNLNSKLKSSTNEYCSKLQTRLFKNFDLVEIHNRPVILFKLVKQLKKIYILFHNDPLSMKGSKTISQRVFILNNVEKIIFVSEWVRERFFLNIDDKLRSKTEVVYPSVNRQRPIKKRNNIIFVGRLNQSKGYDLFKVAILKILDKFPKWKAYSVGDEDRRSIYISHERHRELGFINHNKTLNLLNKSTQLFHLDEEPLEEPL